MHTSQWLPGFYDPCLGKKKQLCVRYLFVGRLHETTVEDQDVLRVPLKNHLLGDTVVFDADEDAAAEARRRRRRRRKIIRRRRKRRRRTRRLVTAFGVAFLGAMVYRNRTAIMRPFSNLFGWNGNSS